jgi:hypothetical protein
MAKLKCEVVWCREDKENRKEATILGFNENILLWCKHKAAITECEASQKIFTEPKKG